MKGINNAVKSQKIQKIKKSNNFFKRLIFSKFRFTDLKAISVGIIRKIQKLKEKINEFF